MNDVVEARSSSCASGFEACSRCLTGRLDLARERPDLVADRPTVWREEVLRRRWAGANACAAGISASDAGPRPRRAPRRLASASRVSASAPGQLLQRLADRRPPGWRTRRAPGSEEVTQSESRTSVRASSSPSSRKLVIDLRDVARAARERVADLGEVLAERLEPAQRGRELLAAAAEALGAALDQQLQVVAGVAVERGEDLVGLHVGLGLRERDRRALLDLRRPRVPGSSSIVMSCRPVRGRSSTVASSWISGAYFCSTSIVTTAWPFIELDLGDVAGLDAGDVHRLALARGDRLRGRELGLELEAVVAEERDPRRVRLLLLGEDQHGRRARPKTSSAPIAMKSRRCSRIARLTGVTAVRSGGAGGRGGPVEVGDRVALCTARRCGTAAARPGSTGWMPSGAACTLAKLSELPSDRPPVPGCRPGWCPARSDAAAAGLEADVRAVAVEALRLAGELDGRVEELAVVRLAGRELVVDHHVAGRDEHVRGAAARCGLLVEQRLRRSPAVCREARARLREQLREAAELGAAQQRARSGRATGWPTSIVVGSSSIPGRDSIASARTAGSASLRCAQRGLGLLERRRQLLEASRERFADSAASAPAKVLKLVIRSERSPSRWASFANVDPPKLG